MNIYVGNLSCDITEEELKKIFEEYGEVSSVNIIKDSNTGRSRGFGFVQIVGKAKAWNAINSLNNKEIKGKEIHVSKARQIEDKRNRFRRYRRR